MAGAQEHRPHIEELPPLNNCSLGMDMGNIVPRRRLRRERVPSETGAQEAGDTQECRPAKGQLVATNQRSKPPQAGGDGDVFHNTDNIKDSLKMRQPTAKEIAAAKAARIRLGYEQGDDEAGEDALAPKLPDGPEPPRPEDVDYVPLEEAKPSFFRSHKVEHKHNANSEALLQEVKSGLQNSNWLAVCKALASLQQLTAHHKEALSPQLPVIAPLMVKHIQSLRSQVSKVAILCYGDLIQQFGNEMLPHVDGQGKPARPSESALAQLLIKSVSKDKKFVLEASQKVLDNCTQTLQPIEMCHKLIGYLTHKSPNVRGAACGALYCSVQRVERDHTQIEKLARSGLLQAAAGLLSDKAPEARAHSRKIVGLVKDAVGQTVSSAGEAPELASEPSSDQENTVTGNVAPGDSDAATAVRSKGSAKSELPAAASSAWSSLCGEVLNASELLNVSRLTRSGGE